MPTATYVSSGGTETTVEVAFGTTVMEAALDNGIDGIIAECGGSAMCATCHVYVESAHLSVAPAMSADEDAMLDEASARREPNSRLSCQLPMGPELDGIRVRLPERQR